MMCFEECWETKFIIHYLLCTIYSDNINHVFWVLFQELCSFFLTGLLVCCLNLFKKKGLSKVLMWKSIQSVLIEWFVPLHILCCPQLTEKNFFLLFFLEQSSSGAALRRWALMKFVAAQKNEIRNFTN